MSFLEVIATIIAAISLYYQIKSSRRIGNGS